MPRSSALRKSATSSKRKPAPKSTSKAAGTQARGKGRSEVLPEWNLDDLYGSIGAPEVTRDLERLAEECATFDMTYKGNIADETASAEGGTWLAAAIRRFETIDDLAGRLVSYAGLVHAGNTVDPAISKFYGDVSERITAASVHLLFF